MLYQLELLTHASSRRSFYLLGLAVVQTLPSLCTVWLRQLGQNFLSASFSVESFLLRLAR